MGRARTGRWGCWLPGLEGGGPPLASENPENLGMGRGSASGPGRARGSAAGGRAETRCGCAVGRRAENLNDNTSILFISKQKDHYIIISLKCRYTFIQVNTLLTSCNWKVFVCRG